MTALIDVDQLRTLIAIAETGSFTKAAEFVHKTQSAVSMQMKRLEERLDRPIFARDPNRPSRCFGQGHCRRCELISETNVSNLTNHRR